jgi:hypothetical protein
LPIPWQWEQRTRPLSALAKIEHEMPEQVEAVRSKPPKINRAGKPSAIEEPQSAVHEADEPESAEFESDRCAVCWVPAGESHENVPHGEREWTPPTDEERRVFQNW